jgi:hypothetical protein
MTATVSPKSASKAIDFTVGQRVLFSYRRRQPAQWVGGVIVGGPRSKQSPQRTTYQVKLDNGESRWGAADQLRRAQLRG